MAKKLNQNFIIHTLASDLGLRQSADPVLQILKFCRQKVKTFLADYRACDKPDILMEWVANKLQTSFVEVHSDAELKRMQLEYVQRGELIFATLNDELDVATFGITLRLQHRAHEWEPHFVSVIDCRGRKIQRRYHTKWHELGHLLVLTDQTRLAFRRTHDPTQPKSAEEKLIDAIAGDLSYYTPMVKPLAEGEISFEKIEQIRSAMCPDASLSASILNIAKIWSTPCIWVEAQLGLKKSDRTGQSAFGFHNAPTPELRAQNVMANDLARNTGLIMIPHFRVPKKSVIYRVFHEFIGYGEAIEDLSWWESSDGKALGACRVLVKAKQIGDSVHALIIPCPEDHFEPITKHASTRRSLSRVRQ